ncbi:MAG: alpha/beta fold hydrolase [Oceanospirillaceae bacterium]|nr:alpha/beta fold hydrolase [Oceanospirillaceae bacterium]
MQNFCPHGTHYKTFGQIQPHKPTLVFIHGVGLDLSLWEGQAKAFKDTHQVITYDMLGHGLSPHAPADITLITLAQQLHKLMVHLQLEKINLVGFSLGGLVARVFAIQHPKQLRSLCIMSSVFDRDEKLRHKILKRVNEVDINGPSANIDQALIRWFSCTYTQENAHYIASLKAKVLANHSASYRLCYRLFGEGDNVMKEHLSHISCPTLVTTGELDPGSTPTMSYALGARLPLATVSILPNARHMMPVENAHEVNQLLHQFISTHQ